MSCFKEPKFLVCRTCKQHFNLLEEHFPGDLFSLLLQSNLPQIQWLCKSCNILREETSRDMEKLNSRVTKLEITVSEIQRSLSKIYQGDNINEIPHPAVNSDGKLDKGEKSGVIMSFKGLSTSITQDIKLHKSDNPWKRLSLTAVPPKDLEKEMLIRSVRGVLNKWTPQKFENLLRQFKGLNIDTEEKLRIVINLIFEAAIDEPKFAVPYANLCKHLALIKVPLVDGGQVNFRKLLLTMCQKEFEQESCDELKHVERMKALEEAEPDKQKKMKLEFDLEEKKISHRQIGNIIFIAELYKLGMLIDLIMHECIKKLLSQGDKSSLEGVSELLKRTGKELDQNRGGKPGDSSPIDMYIAQMQKCVDKRLISARIRFKLQDVIDLRKNSWVPIRDENMPTTIYQIRLKQQIHLQKMSSKYPKKVNGRKPSGRKINTSEEDVASSSSKSNIVLDTQKLRKGRSGHESRILQNWRHTEDVKTAFTDWRSEAASHESSCSNQLFTQETLPTSKEKEDSLETAKVFNRPTECKSQDIQNTSDVLVNELCLKEEMKKKTKPTLDEVLLNNDFKKLDSTVSSMKVKPNTQITIDEIKKNLSSLLEKNKANRVIYNWIEANVSGKGETTFIRALVSAVHENVISGSGATGKLAVPQLKERTALLARFINHNEKLELQALYAIQALMNLLGHPNGLLLQIFDILYDDDVIIEETFEAWKSSNDTNEMQGKEVAVHSVEQFFKKLRLRRILMIAYGNS